MQGSSARDSRRQLSDCKHTALHVTGAHLRTYRPAPAFISEFWRLAVDPLIALLNCIRRMQPFDLLPRGCAQLCHACMHA